MKSLLATAAAIVGAMTLMACNDQPVQRVSVPGPADQSAYRPMLPEKPLPPEGYIPGLPPQGQPMPGQPMPGQPAIGPSPSIQNEDAFVAAYAARAKQPRMMVFVNRTLQGEPLDKDKFTQTLVEERQSATGAVNVNSNHSTVGSGQSTAAGYGGSSASNTNINRTNSSSFISGGPADYTHSYSIKTPGSDRDWIGATSDDYQMIEASLVQYFDNSGKVRIQDSDAARAKLSREQVLRIENGDPAANRLLSVELQQDVLIRVTAKPTNQSINGAGIRLIAKAVSTADARNLGTSFVDMPPQLSKTNINIYTQKLASDLMGQIALKWSQPPQYDPIEVRIYKAASVEDALKIRNWILKTENVKSAQVTSSTGGSQTAYAVLSVGFAGAPEDFYGNLKDLVALNQGLKAVDLTGTTISLEISGPMNLTTTRRSETKTTVETTTVEEKKVEPINPAPPQ